MARRRKRSRDIEMVGAVLGRERVLRDAVETPAAAIPERTWEMAVGSRIAARARPVRLERGQLLVMAATAAWANELQLLSDPMLAQLRRLGVDVREVRFRVGSIEPPVRPLRRPPKVAPAPVTLAPAMVRSLEALDDPELRAAIERAARVSLGFRRDR